MALSRFFPVIVFYFCTDGLSGYVTDDVIASALQSSDDNMMVVESLMEAVYEVGAGDNVTIVVGTI